MNAHDEILLIAEFMGYDTSRIVSELPVDDQGYYTTENGKWVYIESLQYRHSWNHLMKVVEKINIIDNYRYTVFIKSMDVEIYDNISGKNIFESDCKFQPDELLDSVYEAVVEFIKWFNTNKR